MIKMIILFLYIQLINLNFFKNKKENIQQLKTKGSIFKVPVKFNWTKNLDKKIQFQILKLIE